MRPRRLIAALALVVGLLAPAGASAATYGMSDTRPALFDSADLAAMNFQQVRLVLPWNAAYTTGTWSQWLTRAQLQGFPILVALNIDAGHDCTSGDCTGPTPAAYRAALDALLVQYPGIDSVEAWNEPNHTMQPTSRDAALAAHYFDQAYAACGVARCTAVAGNMLDVPSMGSYLTAYRAALQTTPAVWGIHDYYDATYFQRTGLDQLLAVTSGPVWITEVGGLVTFKSATGTLPYDEHRAADSLRWMFSLTLSEPRIARMYLYGMWQQPANVFDSALLRVDNSDRESMTVARAYIGPRTVKLNGPQAPLLPSEVATAVSSGAKSSGAGNALTAASTATTRSVDREQVKGGSLAIIGKRIRVSATRRAVLTVRCIGPASCAGHVELRVGSFAFRHAVSLAASAHRTFKVRLTAAAARSLRAHATKAAWLAACATDASCTASPRTPVVTTRR